ncbi:alanine--tRNA ligase [Edaphobacillus lindanitolerans]|uniref:Alanine--tRNA ligase n=1 Tax=Edaphobacillus lindanitolerans TaxID=550447 RepID=A0A1U7PLX7_9BACI|nr:alanine--tRNA ligase [Edaphobacillus lindanitolerans]SIT82721.1 alanyl-tRNA synthetase [Edaphobacillus lindanitolerans]
MKSYSSAELRAMFLEFFKEKGHAVEPSASLVPVDDPSLLWINSGVATLKKYFDGRVVPANPRIVNSQKAIRTNDIENVGKTARHHTFFEMLGNFSIGDYFKREAILWAWEFLTDEKWIGFDPERLSVTVHPEDEEAYTIWKDEVKIPEERIIRLEGNFWDIGEGPSGPNSEIFYDRGASYGDDFSDPELYPGGENERYLEIWNLVFSEFNHNPDHTYTPLPKQNIDTGMGLERIASVVQDVPTNFDTDLFMPIIRQIEEISGVKYGEDSGKDTAFKVIADHIRTVAFAVGDGAFPSNEGRGYVLRRLLRRAVRYAKQLGVDKPFMYRLVPVVGTIMESYYPEVAGKSEFIQRVIKNEEDRFHETLHEGLSILEGIIGRIVGEGGSVIPGKDVFKLYDTFGFPAELTEEYAEEHGLGIDEDGFREEMEHQRERARAARQDVGSMQVQSGVLGSFHEESEFIGYDHLVSGSRVIAILRDGAFAQEAEEGEEVRVILDKTPFYAESGGQIADRGTITGDGFRAGVQDVRKAPNGQNLHTVKIEAGTMRLNDSVKAEVNAELRLQTVKNHTATHLLHRALKDVLGEHVNQAGSYVGPDRLRFDFSHFGAMTGEELDRVERIVNEQIWAGTGVGTAYHGIEEAKKMGAMALFGEKYGDVVRVVSIGDYSLELCGGCHVGNTAEIGLFKILSEGGIGAGTRRIEALTGKEAFLHLDGRERTLEEAASLVKAKPDDLPAKLASVLEEQKGLRSRIESFEAQKAHGQLDEILKAARLEGDVTVIAAKVDGADGNTLRTMLDELKQKVDKGVIVLGAAGEGKVTLAAGVTKDIAGKEYHAGNLVRHVAEICGGKGGGRPDMAMAGGKDSSKLDEALQSVYDLVKSV